MVEVSTVKLPSGDCHLTLLMTNQHWFRHGLVPSGFKPLPGPMLTHNDNASSSFLLQTTVETKTWSQQVEFDGQSRQLFFRWYVRNLSILCPSQRQNDKERIRLMFETWNFYEIDSLANPPFNSYPLDKMAVISQTIFSSAFSWMKSFVLWLRFHLSLFSGVQLTITQRWFR